MTIFDNQGSKISESSIGNPYGFTGRRFDTETGLWYYRNRMYSAKLGRFLQRDPAGYVDGMNLFSYVKNNPLRFLDPQGLMSEMGDKDLAAFTWSVDQRIFSRFDFPGSNFNYDPLQNSYDFGNNNNDNNSSLGPRSDRITFSDDYSRNDISYLFSQYLINNSLNLQLEIILRTLKMAINHVYKLIFFNSFFTNLPYES